MFLYQKPQFNQICINPSQPLSWVFYGVEIMPIPSPADFRNKTKKHSEVREMMAQMAENVASKHAGYASIVGLAVANINYTTSDRKLTFSNTLFIITGTTRYQLITPQSIDLPLNTPYRLQINTTTKIISAVAYTDAVVEGELILGFATASSTGLKTVDFAYAVDGVAQDNLALAKDHFSKNGFAKLLPLADQNINFVTSTNTLSFTGTIWATSNGQNYQLVTPQNLVLASDGLYRIELNSNTKQLNAVPYSSLRSEGNLLIGVVKKAGTKLTSSDFGYFAIDGVLINPYETAIPKGQRADLQAITVSVDIATKVFTLTGDSWAYTTDGKVIVKGGAYSYPATTGTYVALFNRSTGGIEFYGFSAYLSLLNAGTHYYLFMLESTTGKLYGYSGKSTITGGASVVDPAKTNYSLALTTAENLNFDFKNNKIVVSSNIWIQYHGGRIQIPAQVIELALDRSRGYSHVLLVDPATSSLIIKSQAAPFSVPASYIQIGAYNESSMIFWGLTHYSVNGIPNIPKPKIRPCFGWDTQNSVDLNVSDSFTPSDVIHLGNLTSSIVYGWFDALMVEHPEYITRTYHGDDASGLYPVYSYRFKPLKPSLAVSTEDTKIPKTMLITLHNEKINQVGLYILMREICNNWTNSEALASMRHGMEFVVMPIVNPWGLNHGSRPNSRGVDINRNFPVGWIPLGVPFDATHSGPEPLSEPEAQYAWQVIQDERPDIYIDIHAYGAWNNEGRSIWIPTLNEKARVATTAAILKIYAQYKKKYPWIVDIDKFANVSNDAIVGGGISAKSGTSFGAIGGTFETAWNLKNEPTGLTGHPTAVNLTADLIGTYILQCLAVIIDSD